MGMSDREYRQDDQTRGYCPRCGRELSSMSATRGYCEHHGWQFANWAPYGIGPHWSATPNARGCPRCGSTMYYTIAGVVRRSDGYPDVCYEQDCPIGKTYAAPPRTPTSGIETPKEGT